MYTLLRTAHPTSLLYYLYYLKSCVYIVYTLIIVLFFCTAIGVGYLISSYMCTVTNKGILFYSKLMVA